MHVLFRDRGDAGRQLAVALKRFRGPDTVVLGLTRGGVPVAREVANLLGAPLDALVVRKIGAPHNPEFAIGAIAPEACVLDAATIDMLDLPRAYVDRAVAEQREEMARRQARYAGNRLPIDLAGRTVVVVDDGLATGATASAAVASVRQRHAARVIFAAPVCSAGGAAALRARADDVVCLHAPAEFRAVGAAYEDFAPTSDEEVLECLARSAPAEGAALSPA